MTGRGSGPWWCNVGAFANVISRWSSNTKRDYTRATQAAVEELFSLIVLRTPVDTGRARANWTVGLGAPNTTFNQAWFDKSGEDTISRARSVIRRMAQGETAYIGNQTPYVIYLEYGHSGQAPAGMVRISVADMRGRINQRLTTMAFGK